MNWLSTLYHAVPRPLRIVLLLWALCFAVYDLAPRLMPLPVALLEAAPLGRVYLASDGTPLRHLLNEEGQRVAKPAKIDELPSRLVNATLAAEDKRFFEHGGIDFLALARAVSDGIKTGRVTSGASTITQQLIKISSPPRPRTWQTKVVEMLQARRLEQRWSKERILAAYMNRLSYGNLFAGCPAAAQGYFRKPLRDLTLGECAFLAGLPQAPGRLNPFRALAPAVKRQQWVLARMRDAGWIEREDFEIAQAQPVRLAGFHGGFVAPHAIRLLEKEAPGGGGTVRTTIHAALQRQVEKVISGRLEGLRSRHVDHAAAVVIENATGHVFALAGSRDYYASDGGQINGAWTPRSPGSALKPFTYALAFERGSTPATVIPDLPVEYQTSTGLYRPENYDHKCYGPVTCRMALGNSLNIPAVRLLQESGGSEALQTLLQTLGVSTLTEDADHYGLGLTLGNAPVRLLELANAYAALARLGDYRPWSLLPNNANANTQEMPAILDRTACWWIADILSDNQARAITFGTQSPLRMPFKVAVKTGTSTSYRDNWTLGYTPEFTVGVWAGNFKGQPMDDVTGVTGAAPILRDIFYWLDERFNLTWYERPQGLTKVRIDPRNGKRIGPRTPTARQSREEYLPQERLPPVATAGDYEPKTGRALLPMEYSVWSKTQDNWLSSLVTCLPSRSLSRLGDEFDSGALTAPLRIIQPVDGLIVRLDPDLPTGNRLLLQSMPATGVQWRSATLKIEPSGAAVFAVLEPGEHTITAVRREEVQSIRLHVKAP